MTGMRALLFLLLLALSPAAPALDNPATAGVGTAATTVDLHLFWRDGCPHCEAELAFLARIAKEHPWLRVHRHEVFSSSAARDLYVATARSFGEVPNAVPFTVLGDDYFVGYLDDATSGSAILAAAQRCRAAGCSNRVNRLQAERAARSGAMTPAATATATATSAPTSPASARSAVPDTLHLPLLGDVQTAHLSLPLLTITLAAIDGFNPCAMWALVFLLGLLVGLKDRRRMWLLGVTFVAASAFVYFLFMTAWLNLVLFVGAIGWLRVVIGLVALAGGGWYLYEWKTHRDEQCQVTAAPARRRILDGLRELSTRPQVLLAMAGIIALAFAVNLIELVCSAGIPAVYTQVLAMTPMSTAAHYGYLGLYILVFMLDDLFVLAATLLTLQVTGVTGRYTHTATLVGGVVLVLLGLVMILRPAWLSFG